MMRLVGLLTVLGCGGDGDPQTTYETVGEVLTETSPVRSTAPIGAM